MSINAFLPLGNTITFLANVTGSVPTPVQVVSRGLGCNQYRVINNGSTTAFLGAGPDAAGATANAVVISSSQNCMPLLPGTDEILSFAPNWYFTAITSAGNAVIYMTPGEGL